MKILIRGFYGWGNLGDDILLKVTYGWISEFFPDAEIHVFSNYNEHLNGYENAPGYNRYIHELLGKGLPLVDWTYREEYDIVVDGGGGIYFDHTRGGSLQRMVNALVSSVPVAWNYAADKLFRRLAGKPYRIQANEVIGIGLGVAGFDRAAPSMYRMRVDIGRYTHLWVRDRDSQERLKEMGRKAEYFTDLAFDRERWLPVPEPADKDANKTTVGFTLLDFPAKQLFDEVEIAVERLKDNDIEVKFFAFNANTDKKYIDRFGDRVAVWQPNRMSLNKYLRLFASCDIQVSARAHGCILGACMGQLPVILPSSRKLLQVAGLFPKSSSVLERNFSGSDIVDAVKNRIENKQALYRLVKEEVLSNEGLIRKGREYTKKILSCG